MFQLILCDQMFHLFVIDNNEGFHENGLSGLATVGGRKFSKLGWTRDWSLLDIGF